jgi:hypothetical protein
MIIHRGYQDARMGGDHSCRVEDGGFDVPLE